MGDLRLNLGCGSRKMAGYVNVDNDPLLEPDLLLDLETLPWPFETGSVSEVAMHHVLEHLGQETTVFLGIMRELYRICGDAARINIIVPHHRSESFHGDPTHVRPITAKAMSMFSKDFCRAFTEQGWSNTRLAESLDVDFGIERIVYELTPRWRQEIAAGRLDGSGLNHAIVSYNNVVEQVIFDLRVVKSTATQDRIGRTRDGNIVFSCR